MQTRVTEPTVVPATACFDACHQYREPGAVAQVRVCTVQARSLCILQFWPVRAALCRSVYGMCIDTAHTRSATAQGPIPNGTGLTARAQDTHVPGRQEDGCRAAASTGPQTCYQDGQCIISGCSALGPFLPCPFSSRLAQPCMQLVAGCVAARDCGLFSPLHLPAFTGSGRVGEHPTTEPLTADTGTCSDC